MRKAFGSFIILFLVANLADAQLPEEYTRSVYEKVRHPFPLFDSLGVVSKEVYYYRSGELQYEFYELFENSKEDSVLVFSYLYDTLDHILTTLNIDHYDGEKLVTKYYLKNGKIRQIEYPSISEKIRFLRKNLISEDTRRIVYNYKKGVIKSCASENTSLRLKKRKNRIDTVSIKECINFIKYYNPRGLIDSSYFFDSWYLIGDSISVRTKVKYNQDDELANISRRRRIVRLKTKNRWWKHRQTYKNEVLEKDRVVLNAIHNTSFTYNSKNQLEQVKEFIDTTLAYQTDYQYNEIDSVSSISTTDGYNLLIKEEIFTYDSLYRLGYKQTNYGTGGYRDPYNLNVCRKYITRPNFMTVYLYGQVDSLGKIVTEKSKSSDWHDNFRLPYSQAKTLINGKPLRRNTNEEYEETALFNCTLFGQDGSFKELDWTCIFNKYDALKVENKLIITNKTRENEELGHSIIKQFYTFKL